MGLALVDRDEDSRDDGGTIIRRTLAAFLKTRADTMKGIRPSSSRVQRRLSRTRRNGSYEAYTTPPFGRAPLPVVNTCSLSYIVDSKDEIRGFHLVTNFVPLTSLNKSLWLQKKLNAQAQVFGVKKLNAQTFETHKYSDYTLITTFTLELLY